MLWILPQCSFFGILVVYIVHVQFLNREWHCNGKKKFSVTLWLGEMSTGEFSIAIPPRDTCNTLWTNRIVCVMSLESPSLPPWILFWEQSAKICVVSILQAVDWKFAGPTPCDWNQCTPSICPRLLLCCFNRRLWLPSLSYQCFTCECSLLYCASYSDYP